ncbi:type II CAAX endopeptidase family protein [Microlunatus speluncae]|uniref:type II CAAX endopeptidase family protein n=1 Tax=Microlunatus speluncae TaxID=2594267 RepID=UPI0012665041|nr:type II CAAX endopeptidase family protein [Microlunatus speluncae]
MSVPVGPPPPAYPVAPAPVSPLPVEPSEYQQLYRGPRRRWWKPLLSLLLTVAFWMIIVLVLTVGYVVYGALTGQDMEELLASFNEGALGADVFLFNNLILIALIPSVLFANWIVHRIRPGYTGSVAGRIRWGWMARCLIVLLPVWVVYLGVGQVIFPPASPRPEQWLAFLIIVLLTTPLQCAAEEYAFRGWILQNLGSWIKPPVVAIVISTIVSAVTFALAHSSLDPFVLADIGLFAVVAMFLTWRTGGLEAAIAMHIVNNVLIFITIVIFGGWAEALVGPETTGSPITLVLSVVVDAIAVALILWQAKRAKIDRLYRPGPAQLAAGSPSYPAVGQHPYPTGQAYPGAPQYPGGQPYLGGSQQPVQPHPEVQTHYPATPSFPSAPPYRPTQPPPDQPPPDRSSR